MRSGYLSKTYADSLAEFGTPRHLPDCGGWVLVREIPGTQYQDAMGLYPLFSCLDWGRITEDLSSLGDLVSLTLVTDPFGNPSQESLGAIFGIANSFKDHYIVEPARDYTQIVSKHHRQYARNGLAACTVEIEQRPSSFLDTWTELYGALVVRHGITGIQAFSRKAFALQLRAPGLVIFKAIAGGQVVGAHLWYVQGNVAYSHLAATSPQGYDAGASYALHAHAIEHFYRDDAVAWLDLGAGAGATGGASGLDWFKKGWAQTTRPAFLCCKIFQPDVYEELAGLVARTTYFPAYRGGELV